MPASILVVDDEPNIVLSLEFIMQKEGYDVRIAKDGEAALKAIREKVPDLVLLDIMMPAMSGYEVCQRIRANPEWKDIRIVMLTAKGREGDQEKGMAMGADEYITKPFATRDLMARVKMILGEEH